MSKATDWQEQAACRGIDTNLFYPYRGEMIDSRCSDACARCVVLEECLSDSLLYETSRDMTVGYRAGMSARARFNYRVSGIRSNHYQTRGRPRGQIAEAS